jgi:hypothetical protein
MFCAADRFETSGIPIEAAQVYRFEAAHRSDMMPPTVPI